MKIKTWNPEMSDKETADLAYWERNVLALNFAEGWYYDDIPNDHPLPMKPHIEAGDPHYSPYRPRYPGWGRVLSLAGGTITFHIPDDFSVGTLPQIKPNWDGHTTEEKWRRILASRGIG